MDITINAYRDYLADRYGGWTTEQGLFMKLVEEVGEVAEVLNKRSGAKAGTGEDLSEELGTELADVIHYAVAIAAINGLDLNAIMLAKDKRASEKYHHDTFGEISVRPMTSQVGQKRPPISSRCHCEERSDAAISWNNVRIRTQYQEIATPSARNDSDRGKLVLLMKAWHSSNVVSRHRFPTHSRHTRLFFLA